MLALISAAFVVVIYGLARLAGLVSRKLGRPGIYRGRRLEGTFWLPLIGVVVGVLLVLGDRFFMWAAICHRCPTPASPFPRRLGQCGHRRRYSSAALSWARGPSCSTFVLRRWRMTHLALWIANIIAALAFAAGHLPTVLVLYGGVQPGRTARPACRRDIRAQRNRLAGGRLALHDQRRFGSAIGIHFGRTLSGA